jgi:hypothetical protein
MRAGEEGQSAKGPKEEGSLRAANSLRSNGRNFAAEVEQKVSLLNEPIHVEVIELRPRQSAASLYALLVGLCNQAQALLERLETRAVYVPSAGQQEVVRALYVATRNQVRALSAVLELDGLE